MKDLPILADYDKCTGCMLCADVCSRNAITFSIDSNGYWTYRINPDKCIGCKLCEKKCLEVRSNSFDGKAEIPFKGNALSDDTRQRSTSGGIFYAIAETAIKWRQAVVYGVACDGTDIHHIAVETIEDLKRLQGSKYAQSYIQGAYRSAEKHLRDGRYVIFSGTPCQINALKVYLKKDYENLICIDLICHGVPSHQLMYRHLAVNDGDGIVKFRTKSKGWGRDSYTTISKNGKERIVDQPSRNLFYHAFQSELCFRPNCYNCRYNNVHRVGDITLGDFWAARFSEEYDILGISTILPNTQKGLQLLNDCDKIVKEQITWTEAVKFNPRLHTNRPEYLRLALSKKLGLLYKMLPDRIADYIIEAWHSKKRGIFYFWSMYVNHQHSKADRQIESRQTK